MTSRCLSCFIWKDRWETLSCTCYLWDWQLTKFPDARKWTVFRTIIAQYWHKRKTSVLLLQLARSITFTAIVYLLHKVHKENQESEITQFPRRRFMLWSWWNKATLCFFSAFWIFLCGTEHHWHQKLLKTHQRGRLVTWSCITMNTCTVSFFEIRSHIIEYIFDISSFSVNERAWC